MPSIEEKQGAGFQTKENGWSYLIRVMSVLNVFQSQIFKENLWTRRKLGLAIWLPGPIKYKWCQNGICSRKENAGLWNTVCFIGEIAKHLEHWPSEVSISSYFELALWILSHNLAHSLSQFKGRWWWMGAHPVVRMWLAGGLQRPWHEVRFYFPYLLIISRGGINCLLMKFADSTKFWGIANMVNKEEININGFKHVIYHLFVFNENYSQDTFVGNSSTN